MQTFIGKREVVKKGKKTFNRVAYGTG